MWRSQVPTHPHPLAELWKQRGQAHLPLLPRHRGWGCPPSVSGYPWLQSPYPHIPM